MPLDAARSELQEYLAVLWLRKWSILTIAGIALAGALFYSSRQTPTYGSSAEVLVRPINLSSENPNTPNGFLVMAPEQALATSQQVASIADEQLRKQRIAPGGIGVEAPADSQTLIFNGSSTSPKSAQATAQAFADAYLKLRRDQALQDLKTATDPIKREISRINKLISATNKRLLRAKDQADINTLTLKLNGLNAQLSDQRTRLNEFISPRDLRVGEVIQPAGLPSSPAGPDRNKAALLGVFVGLSLGIGLAFLRDRVDQRVRGREDLESRAGAPVMAIIPHVPRRKGGTKVITVADPGSEAAEAYRGLRTRLLYAASKDKVKSVIITSSEAGEGKTTTAVNLAVSLTQSGRRVVLVSADLRRPGLERYFPNSNGLGLVDVLSGKLKPLDAMFWTGLDNLWLLPSGPHSATPAEMLGSTAMTELIKQLEASSDLVLIDTTPVLGLSDALNIAPMTDSVLFVADANRASRGAIQEASHQLTTVGASLIGVVLTNFEASRLNPYYPRYGRYYRPHSQPTPPHMHQDAMTDGQYT